MAQAPTEVEGKAMKHRPHQRAAPRGNPLASLFAVDRTQPHTPAEVAKILNPVQTALVCMLEGTADDRDFARLGTVVNLSAFRIQLKGAEVGNAEPLMAQLVLAGTALEEARGIKDRHGRYGLSGLGRQHLAAGVEVYRALVEASSPLQMHRAEQDLWQHLGRMERQAA
jgi:hypothetical protein